VTVNGTLTVSSGTASGTTAQGYGAGGAATFHAATLVARTINLTKNDGALTFSVGNLQIGSNFDTTLKATGTWGGGDTASIDTLLLTGNKNFTLTGNAASNVTVGNLTINGGTLNDENWNNLINNLGGVLGKLYLNTQNITLGTGGATVDISNNQTLSRVLTGAGGLAKTGDGTLTLSGAIDYRGGTTVSGGTLSIGSDEINSNIGTPDLGKINMLAGGTLQLTGATFTQGWTLGAGSNAIETPNNTTFDGSLTGSGGFSKTGAGTLTLTGANTYTGLTEVRAGTLELDALGSISSSLALYGNTTFRPLNGAPVLSRLDVYGPAAWTGNLNMAGQTMNYYLPTSLTAGSTMLAVSGTAAIDGSTVNVGINGASSPLQKGDQVILIDAQSGLTGTPANVTSNGKAAGMQGVTLNYTFDLSTTNNELIATLASTGVNPQSKALSEGRVAGVAGLNQGADHLAGKGITSAVEASGGMSQSMRKVDSHVPFGFGAFGSVSGGSMRYNTGSHVDMSSLSLIAGLSLGVDLPPGRLTLGAFFEYGTGSYNTYNSFSNAASVDGKGNTYNLGGGVLGRLDFLDTGPGHAYLEGSFRLGGITNNYDNSDLRDDLGHRAGYDSYSPYYGLHGGLGYIWSITEAASLDLYGKYFWTKQQGNDVRLSTGEKVKFKDIDSNRLRLGGRFAYAVNEYVSPYIGAAYEREFNGKARATTNGYDLASPSLLGDTGIGELGLMLKPSKTLPLSFDLGIQGYVGKREGVTGSLQIRYEF